jgi:hypothetical protein
MDMLPPQAPPAITQGTNQEAVDAVSRLVDAQAWLLEQQAALPVAPDLRHAEALPAHLDALEAFWAMSVPDGGIGSGVPRSTAMASRLASIMRDEAALRLADGTLAPEAAELALRFARSHGGSPPPGLHAAELLLDGSPDVATVIVSDERLPDLVLLFTPTRGWDAFPSLAELHAEAEYLVNRDIAQGVPPPVVPIDDRLVFDDIVRVDSRPLDGDPFQAMVRRLMEVQRERMRNLADDAAQGFDDAGADGERALTAARLGDMIDVAALLRARHARLTTALLDERLDALPQPVQDEWRDAVTEHQAALQRSQRFDDAGAPDLVPLRDFARRTLKELLAGKGFSVDPDDVTVSAHEWPYDSPQSSPDESFPLTDLALRNVGIFDNRLLVATGPDGQPLARQLTHERIKQFIRDLDVARKYHDYLLDALKTSPEGQLTRTLAVDLQRARMRLNLAEARVSYHRKDEPDQFRPDRRERAHAWVKAVVDSPSQDGRERVEGHTIVASQITYNGAVVRDVLMIGAEQEGAVSTVVFYTPDAPDGLSFREFRSRGEASAEFFNAPAFDGYLLDRLPNDVAVQEAGRRERRFARSAASEQFRWVFSQSPASKPPRKVHRFEEKAIRGDVFEAQYDAALSIMARNIEPLARTSAAAVADEFPDIDVESIQRSFARFIGRPFAAAWRSYDSVKAGDHAQGFIEFTNAYVSALDFLALPAFKPLTGRTIAVRTARQSRRVGSTGKALRDPDTVFPEAYRARVKASDAKSVEHGIHYIEGRPHIQQDGAMYAARFDADNATWRLVRPGAPGSGYAIPVARDAGGTWRYNRNIGLRGGHPDAPRPADLSSILRQTMGHDPSLRGMTNQQLAAMERGLIQRVGSYEAAQALALRRSRLLPMRGSEHEHWRAASDAAWAARPIATPRTWRPLQPAIPHRSASRVHDLIPIDRSQWPTTVRHFTRADSLAAIRTDYFLTQSLTRRGFPSGVYVTTLDPATSTRTQISRAISGASQWRWAGNFQKKMDTWLELDTSKLPQGSTLYRVSNTSAETYVIRPPAYAGGGGIHTAKSTGFSLPDLNIRAAVTGTGNWVDGTVPRS